MRKCRNKACGERFTPFRMGQIGCCTGCEIVLAKDHIAKARNDRAKAERKADKARKEAIKTIPELKREAQTAFNAFIRFRDKDMPCISSGKPLSQEAIGGGFDAGHYRSIGSAPHLRFNENNVHGQSKQDNRYGAGRAVEYRIGLIARIGLEAVEALEADNAYHKWTADELKAIKTTYKEKLKELQKCQ